MTGLEKSFLMMYSNIGLSFRWTLPLSMGEPWTILDSKGGFCLRNPYQDHAIALQYISIAMSHGRNYVGTLYCNSRIQGCLQRIRIIQAIYSTMLA